MKRIGIYPRKSVYRDNSESISVQVRLCREYSRVVYQGEELEFHIYDQDEGFSGKNTNRPSFQALMSDVRHNLLDVVMVYRLDRISRNVPEFSAMFDVFQKHNAAFVSVKESFDTGSPIGRTVMYILAAFAQLERENISGRVADNMEALGSSGKWTGGKLPVGMKSITQKNADKLHSFLVVDNDSIWLVKQLYEMLLGGYSITAMERYCRDNHITSLTGKFLSTSQIYNIITNPVYCQADSTSYSYFQKLGCQMPENPQQFDGSKGLTAYGRTTQNKNGRRRADFTDWHINVGIHDSVIPSSAWIAAQERLGINKSIRSNKYQAGILKGVLRCKCGSRMYNRVYSRNGTLFAYYYCEDAFRKKTHAVRYYRIDEIDPLFIKQLKEIRLNPDYIIIQQIQTHYPEPNILRTEIRSVEAAIGNLTRQLQENTASTATKYIIAQIELLDKRLNTLHSQLYHITSQHKQIQTEDKQREEIYTAIANLLKDFNHMNYTEKNELIRKITKNCVLDGDNLDIIF